MKKLLIIAAAGILMAGFTVVMDYPVDPAQVRAAINRSLPLLQQSSHTFLLNAGGCHSCHGQSMGAVSFSMAKEKGFVIQDTILREALDSIQSTWVKRSKYLAQHEDPTAVVVMGSYDLWAFSANKIASDKVKALLAFNIMHRQRKDGSWVSPNLRPPMEYYSFTATALAVKGIKEFIPPAHKAEVNNRVQKAESWLLNTKASTNEERIFQILGLVWIQSKGNAVDSLAERLFQKQHPNGGWSQTDSLPADAYATGQSLYALLRAGTQKNNLHIQKGLQYLLRTQHEDGSWHIRTRSFPSVPFVESGFPHGPDQFISAAGSHWATIALIEALE